jgi:ABC-type antimicrobial peptide transport system permease subunit
VRPRVISYNVVQRTTEIGVRIALGAQIRTVLWMVLRESLIMLGIGLGLGLPLAIAATKRIRNQLFGLSAIDLVTFVPYRRCMPASAIITNRHEGF